MATNLQFIKQETVTTASSLVEFDNFFNTQEYDTYCIIYSDIHLASLSDTSMRLIDNSGSVITATEYEFATLNLRCSSTFSKNQETGATNLRRFFGRPDTESSGEPSNGVIYVYNPLDSTKFTYFHGQSAYCETNTEIGNRFVGVHKSAETIRGFAIFNNAGTNVTSGKISLYGVQ
ncbi:2-phosphosulfolactate phosphatase [uncultured Mediterranean phage uvMED]|jgi:hypothetical protein|nr:2-phosphosulfolactate phosphatase [uncultured Mediterranean phage uvMED]BAR14785.1 2-phosphosulfolactate phosphatase [uncultured Mediterranean phage uvMED]